MKKLFPALNLKQFQTINSKSFLNSSNYLYLCFITFFFIVLKSIGSFTIEK